MSQKNFDITICGGGMVGMALANSLADNDFSVAVIENKRPKNFDQKQDFDLRVSAITRETIDFFKNLEVWEYIKDKRMCALHSMRVWEESGFGDVTFDANSIEQDNIGYIVENRILQISLWEKAEKNKNISILCPETHLNVKIENDQAEIALESGECIHSKLLVGADGANSSIRENFEFGLKSKQYDQSCLVANAKVDNQSQNITWQRFTPCGPQAYLPLDNNTGSIVWYDSAENIESYVNLNNEELSLRLMETFPYEIGKVSIKNKASFPIFKRHVDRYVLNQVALVGDAAHVINPLAGQGVNLGFQDVECLTRTLKSARDKTDNWSSAESMIKYERERYFANSLMMNAMNIFYYSFSNDSHPIKLARNFALYAARFNPINKLIGKFGSGSMDNYLFK